MKKVTMYTLSTCPWCRKTKKYFTDRGIAYEFIDYDLADDATQERIVKEMDSYCASGFPFVKIGEYVVEGYRPDRYAELLEP
ncbi:MAG: glutaredoxin family protein [Spirochaetaceae bacterium]|nr:glutaredoxin family protein [Spirochaetaceae bacterium]